MTTILLIRHGESEANREGFFAGQNDVKLLDKGLMQAEATAQFIKKSYKVDRIYSSDLIRAYDTALAVSRATGLPVSCDERLREIYSGLWQGMRFDDIIRDFGESYGVWLRDIGNAVCDGGESVRQLGERVMAALTDIAVKNDGSTVVIATHATPIRAMQCIVSGLDLGEMRNIPWVSNASVTELIFEDGKFHLGKVGQDVHLSGLRTVFPSNV